jgi:hypothetical protein
MPQPDTTSPKSKGIVGVVVRVVPDGGESRRARGSRSAGVRALLLAQTDEVHEILDFSDPLGRERLNLLDQC